MASKNKFYAVWKGRETGIFSSWDECKKQINGYEGAQFKAYPTEIAACRAMQGNYWQAVQENKKQELFSADENGNSTYKPEQKSLTVDAACSGNPGRMEYRGVDVRTGKEVFRSPVFEQGTNNIGEFLALVHGLSWLKQQNLDMPIYSDSENAIKWVRSKKCRTKLDQNDKNTQLFNLIDRAEKWLAQNSYSTQILKWETESWGEIPADFGRK